MVLAFVDAGSTLGVMAAGFLVPLAVVDSTSRLGWLSLGIFGMVLGVVDFIAIRSYPRPVVPPDSGHIPIKPKSSPPAYGRLFRDRRFWLIGLAYLLTGFAVMAPFTLC